MTFQPGHTLSPGRRPGSRNKRTAEIFYRLESRGDLDPADLLSSIVTNNEEPKELRIQAAGLLMPYKYSKCGTAPVQVYIDVPLDTPEFTHLSDAEQFLAKVAALVAQTSRRTSRATSGARPTKSPLSGFARTKQVPPDADLDIAADPRGVRSKKPRRSGAVGTFILQVQPL